MEVRIEAQGEGRFLLAGELSFATAAQALARGSELFGKAPQLVLDLSSVTHTDSAGLALLVEWLRMARHRKQTITFRNIPEQMMAIARVSSLEDILPLNG